MARVFIIHGWEGHPEDGWIPWLKKELEKEGHEVHAPEMPDTEHPEIEAWVHHIDDMVGVIDENTYFVGHSIGCQAIIRYLQAFSNDKKAGGVVLIAPWVTLKKEALEEEGATKVAKPWLETPIEWEKVKKHVGKVVAIFSDNDPYVPKPNQDIFKTKLDAKIIIEHGKGHMGGEDKTFELPSAKDELFALF